MGTKRKLLLQKECPSHTTQYRKQNKKYINTAHYPENDTPLP